MDRYNTRIEFSAIEDGKNTDNPVFVNFTEKEGLPENSINSLIEDKKGNIWISSQRGLSRLQLSTDGISGKIFHLSEKEGLPWWVVKCTMEDKNGDIWIGDAGGLNIL
jgi:ligand-binding sensor domain-containing protein